MYFLSLINDDSSIPIEDKDNFYQIEEFWEIEYIIVDQIVRILYSDYYSFIIIKSFQHHGK